MLQGGKLLQFAVLRLVSDCNAGNRPAYARGALEPPTDTTMQAPAAPLVGGGEEVN